MNIQAGNHSSPFLTALRSVEANTRCRASNRFSYCGIREDGESVRGTLVAPTREAAQRKLLANYRHLLTLEESPTTNWREVVREWRNNSAALPAYTRSIAAMMSAGLHLPRIFETAAQGEDTYLNQVMLDVAKSLRSGHSLTKSLARWKTVFSPTFVGMVGAAEKSGRLHVTFRRLADLSEKEWRLKQQLRSAATYPVLISLVSVAIFWILVAFVVPGLAPSFAAVGNELPWPTRFLVWLGECSTSLSLWLTGLGCVGLGSTTAYRVLARGGHLPQVYLVWDRLKLSIPMLGELFKLSILHRSLSTMAAMLESGIPLTHVLLASGEVTGSPKYQRKFDSVLARIRNGSTFAQALNQTDGFPLLVGAIAQVGEESGRLPFMLGKLSELYEQELENKLQALMSLLEPALMAVLGLVVGFIVLGTFLPMLNLIQNL